MTQNTTVITAKSTRKEIVAELVRMEGSLYNDIHWYAAKLELKYKGETQKKAELQAIYKEVANAFVTKLSVLKQAQEAGLELDPKSHTVKQIYNMIKEKMNEDAEEQIQKVEEDAKQKGIVVEQQEEKVEESMVTKAFKKLTGKFVVRKKQEEVQEEVKPVVVDVDAEEELEGMSEETMQELQEVANQPQQEVKEDDPKKLTLEQKRARNIQHVLNNQKPEDVVSTLVLAGFKPTFDVNVNATMLVDNYKAIKEAQRKQAEPTVTVKQAKAMATQVAETTVATAQEEIARVQEEEQAKANDINFLYDALKTKSTELQELANQLAQAGKMEESNTVMSKFYEVQEKISGLVREHKDVIFSGARATKLVNDARQSMADGLRTTAVTTDKYGHAGVDTLLNVANQVLNGAVEVSKKVLEGGEAIAKTGINVAGTVGHATVDGVSGTLNAAADIIEPKQK